MLFESVVPPLEKSDTRLVLRPQDSWFAESKRGFAGCFLWSNGDERFRDLEREDRFEPEAVVVFEPMVGSWKELLTTVGAAVKIFQKKV